VPARTSQTLADTALVKRRGKLKALVAVARSILVIVWHLLADPTAALSILVLTSTSYASTRNAGLATSFASSRRSATRSPSARSPDRRDFVPSGAPPRTPACRAHASTVQLASFSDQEQRSTARSEATEPVGALGGTSRETTP
jgi:hypothetical protein